MKDREELMTGKRLLILGGAGQTLKVVRQAREMGIYTVVTDIAPATEAKSAADSALPYSVMDSDALIDWCRRNPVDGVLNFNIDFAQHSHQRICTHFGFPCYGTDEQYDCLTDKRKFKLLCGLYGIDVIMEFCPDRPDEMVFPVLVKPAEGSGSRGASICQDAAELPGAIAYAREATRNAAIIIEKYMEGCPDLELVYFVHEGEPYLLYAGDRIPGKKEYGLDQQCVCFLSPSKYMQSILDSVHPRICHMLKQIGLENAPVFFQGFLDGEAVRLYDSAIRFPGDEFVSIVKELTGVDLVRAMIQFALTGDTGLNASALRGIHHLDHRYGALYQLQAQPGVLGRFDGMDEVRKLPFTVAAVQKHFAGESIADTKDLNRRIGEVAIKGSSDLSSITDAIRQIKTHLKVEDANGHNMLIDSFDRSSLSEL